MGYTHYWDSAQFKQESFERLGESTKSVITLAVAQGIMVDREYDDADTPPLIDSDKIVFNGRGEEGHETFRLEREVSGFNFCKTAYKPYDAVVVAVLILAHYYNPDFYWSSDGDSGDFAAGLALAKEVVPAIAAFGVETADSE
jgi:hypothetical protein